MNNPSETGLWGQAVQPWDPAEAETPEHLQRRRDRLLALLATSELGTVEDRVARVLQKYPDTRDNDTALAIRYWREYEAAVLARWPDPELEVLHELQPMATIIRSRQRIQNDFDLFVGTRRTRAWRDERQMMFYQYLAEKRDEDPELCFYLDETGSDTNRRYVGVGGICVLDTRSYEMRHAALRHWRQAQAWPETLHFQDMNQASEPKYLALMAQLEKWRAGLLFVGYATLSRGRKEDVLVSLFVQLVCDALKIADEQGCLGNVRAVRIVKEGAEGFDRMHLHSLEADLSQQLYKLFPNRVYLRGVTPVAKGREVLLECADTLAAAMQRRWESGNSIHKDRVAEAAMNVTGFEDKADGGAMYRIHMP